MGDKELKRYIPKRRRGGIVVVMLALFFALCIPLGLIMAQKYFAPEREALSSSSEPDMESGAASETPEPTPEPTPTPNPYSNLPESSPVEQEYFDDAVFFGDSITDGIRVYEVMSNATVVAATGANPDSALTKEAVSVSGQAERSTMIEALAAAAPGKIYVMLGANWIGENSGISPETYINHYKTLLERIRADNPTSVIYVQSMLPVTEAYDTNSSGKNNIGITNAIISECNLALSALCEELSVYYLDVFGALVGEDGFLPEDASSDGMHLVAEYYEKWFDYIKTHTAPPADDFIPTGGGEAGALPEGEEPQVIEPEPDVE